MKTSLLFARLNARLQASSMLESRSVTGFFWYAIPLVTILLLLTFAPNTVHTLRVTLFAAAMLATASGWNRMTLALLSRRTVRQRTR